MLFRLGGGYTARDKWLGGALGSDGAVYGVPGSAKYMCRLDPDTCSCTITGERLVGPKIESSLRRSRFKYLRGICHPVDHHIYCLPSNATSVLRYDTTTGSCTAFGGPFAGVWKWHGGVMCADGNIYCVPANAETVLCIKPTSLECIEFGGPMVGDQKWYGGLLGVDGCVYCIPNCADSVLRIDP